MDSDYTIFPDDKEPKPLSEEQIWGEKTVGPTAHLWTDEQVAKLKADGVITEDKFDGHIKERGACQDCGKPLGPGETILCDGCMPF